MSLQSDFAELRADIRVVKNDVATVKWILGILVASNIAIISILLHAVTR